MSKKYLINSVAENIRTSNPENRRHQSRQDGSMGEGTWGQPGNLNFIPEPTQKSR